MRHFFFKNLKIKEEKRGGVEEEGLESDYGMFIL